MPLTFGPQPSRRAAAATTPTLAQVTAAGASTSDAVTVLRLTASGGTWSIDAAGNAVFNGEVDVGSLLASGLIYSQSSHKLLNKAGSGYLFWATRNTAAAEAVYDLSNLGTIAAAGAATFGGTVGLKSYTVATLPAAGTPGRVAYASDGRKTGELGGAGTGLFVADDGTAWRAAIAETTVTA